MRSADSRSIRRLHEKHTIRPFIKRVHLVLRLVGRAFLAYGRSVGSSPLASVAAFEDFVGSYREVGMNEFIFYYPPEEYYPRGEGDEADVFERVAREVIPAMRKG